MQYVVVVLKQGWVAPLWSTFDNYNTKTNAIVHEVSGQMFMAKILHLSRKSPVNKYHIVNIWSSTDFLSGISCC